MIESNIKKGRASYGGAGVILRSLGSHTLARAYDSRAQKSYTRCPQIIGAPTANENGQLARQISNLSRIFRGVKK